MSAADQLRRSPRGNVLARDPQAAWGSPPGQQPPATAEFRDAQIGELRGDALAHLERQMGLARPSGAGEVVLEFAGWELVVTDEIADEAFFVDRAREQTFISPATWETLRHDESAFEEFLGDFDEGSGMKYMVRDSGKYGEAARREAEARGAIGPALGLLEVLEADASGLLVQAAGINGQPTQGQVQIFHERVRELHLRYESVEAQLARIKSTIDLAAVAVAEVI